MIVVLIAVLAAAPAAPAREYRVVEGDTCLAVAQKLGITAAQLHQFNPLMGPAPHRLQVGSILAAAPAPLAPDARLTFLRPDVDRRPASTPSWLAAALNEPLYRLDEVSTRRGAGAELTFPNESRLQLKENALVVVLGNERGGPQGPRKGGGLDLVQGEMSLFLSRFQTTPLKVQTPAGQVNASTPQADIAVDAAKMTRLSVHAGTADVTAMGSTVNVREGEGTRVEKGKAPEKPRPLPKSPQLGEETTRGLFSREGAPATVTIAWGPIARASAYHVEVAREARFVDLVEHASSAAQTVSVPLGPGRYFVRVTAVDDAGLRSKPSAARQVQVVGLVRNGAALTGSVRPGEALGDTGHEGLSLKPAQLWAAGEQTVELLEGDRVLDRLSVKVQPLSFTLTSTPSGPNRVVHVDVNPPLPAGAPLSFEAHGVSTPVVVSENGAAIVVVPRADLEQGGWLVFDGTPVAVLAPPDPPRESEAAVVDTAAVVAPPPSVRCAPRPVLPSTEVGALGWPAVNEGVCASAGLLGGPGFSPEGASGKVWLGAGLPLFGGFELRASGQLSFQRAASQAEAGLSVDGAWAVRGSPLTLGGSMAAGAKTDGTFAGRAAVALAVALAVERAGVRLRTAQGVTWGPGLGAGYSGELDAMLLFKGPVALRAQAQAGWRPGNWRVDAAAGPAVLVGPLTLGLAATLQTRTAEAPIWGLVLGAEVQGAPWSAASR